MNTLTKTPLDGGFIDPVQDAQQVFRTVLGAMARPGTVAELPALPQGTGGLPPAAAAVLLALADLDTPLWLDEAATSERALEFLRFHCGSPIAKVHGDAVFAVLADGSALPDLNLFSHGSPEHPDRSTTLIVAVHGLTAGEGATFSGPGIDGTASLTAQGLDPAFWAHLSTVRELFPMGLDTVLVSGSSLACLPRSVRIQEA